MERGLLWLPLLGMFIWLAWSGWNEYQKLEAYNQWAAEFERSKYDIYAALGQKGSTLTWGKPTRKGPINLESIALDQVQTVQLLVNEQPADLANPPAKGRAALELSLPDQASVKIPFTQPELAARWGVYLSEQLSKIK